MYLLIFEIGFFVSLIRQSQIWRYFAFFNFVLFDHAQEFFLLILIFFDHHLQSLLLFWELLLPGI